jgi:hypothetical protein
MRLLHRLFLWIVILWLPLQGYAAVAMPFCKHGMGDTASAQMNAGDHQHHQHHHQGKPGDDSHRHGGSTMGFSCSDCGACQLACCSFIPPDTADLTRPLTRGGYDIALPAALYPFIPETPSRPPLTAIA